MGETLGFTTVKAARREHQCSYCGEDIVVGQPYSRWLWVDGFDTSPCKMHPECLAAHEASGDEMFDLCANERPKKEEVPDGR